MRTQSTQVSILGAFSFSFKYIDYLQAKAKKEYEEESVQFNYKPSITRNSYTRNFLYFNTNLVLFITFIVFPTFFGFFFLSERSRI